MSNEITIEITSYCQANCDYCSSDANEHHIQLLSLSKIKRILKSNKYCRDWDRIHISGGEPLAHPEFYKILEFCKTRGRDIIVHTNAIRHIAFNPNVIDGIYVDAYLNVPETTDEIHILKRINQGREKRNPIIRVSSNWTKDCSCNHNVIQADGNIAKSPCAKEKVNGDYKIDRSKLD